MQVTETTLDIIDCLGGMLFSGSSINALSLQLGKAYPLVHAHVKLLCDEHLLHEEHIGNARRCTLDLSNEQSQLLLGFTTARKHDAKTTSIIKKLTSISKEYPLSTAFTIENKLYLVTERTADHKKIQGELPFAGIHFLSISKAKKFLLLLPKDSLPTPILREATYFALLGEVQHLANDWRNNL